MEELFHRWIVCGNLNAQKNLSAYCALDSEDGTPISEVEFDKHFWLSIDPEDRGEFIFEMNRLISMGENVDFNFRFYDYKKSQILSFNRKGLRRNGTVMGSCRVLSVVDDLNIKNYIDSVKSGVLVFDDFGEIVQANDKALNILNSKREDILNKFFIGDQFNIIDQDYNKIEYENYPNKKAERTKYPVLGEVIGIQKINTIDVQWLRCSAVVQYFSGKKYILFTFVDVSNQINDSREVSKFFDLSLNFLCIAGLDAKYKKINPQFCNLLGYSEDEILKKPILDLIHPGDKEKTIKAVSALAEGEKIINFENRYICKDGSYKSIDWKHGPEPGTGRIYAVGVDRTEERIREKHKEKISQIKKSLYIK